jgi:N-acetylmuramic acid 6-phosphate etherase
MLDRLVTESRNPQSEAIDDMSALEIVELMNREDALVASAVATESNAIAKAIDLIADQFRQGGRLIYIGAGTSGRLGVLDASECPPTFSSPPQQVIGLIAGGPSALTTAVEGAEDRADFAQVDLEKANLGPLDVLVGIATSGRTPYVIEALRLARQRGAATVSLACNRDSEVERLADISIAPVVGPEILSGSTRLKAGTATKLVLNMLSTGAMVRIGKTYCNLLVDLQATNTKLKTRAQRIVQHLTNLDAGSAAELLTRCNGELKTSIVSARLNLSPDEARQRLQNAAGHLRRAIQTETDSASSITFSDLLLGIDAGGTSTEAVLARRDGTKLKIIGRGTAGPANPQVIGFDAAIRAIRLATAKAFEAASLQEGRVGRACLAIAGAGRAADQQQIHSAASAANLADEIAVVDDAVPLLAAGTPEGWGLVLIAGTGSLARGRTIDGQTARAGGWGYLLGDEGSSYSLGLAALNAVAKALDGRAPRTTMVELCLQALGDSAPEAIIDRVYRQSISRASIAELAQCVTAAAEKGDNAAIELLQRAAAELALMLQAVATKLGFIDQPVPLALAGGLLVHCPALQKLMSEQCSAIGLRFDPVTLVPCPAEGALALAADSSRYQSAR